MVNCENLSLSILDINKYILMWDNNGNSEGDKLTIERSDAETSEYEKIGEVSDDLETFTDTDAVAYQKYIPFYYRIKHHDGTYSSTVSLPLSPNKYLIQQNRMVKRYLQRDVGQKSFYFHYKRTGAHCDCWDTILKKSVVKDCKKCAGTGRIKGYADPIEIFVSYPQEAPDKVVVNGVAYVISTPKAWTGNEPFLFDSDIIIRDYDKEVFKVEGRINRTGYKMYPSRQFFGLRAIERGSVEFDLIKRVA